MNVLHVKATVIFHIYIVFSEVRLGLLNFVKQRTLSESTCSLMEPEGPLAPTECSVQVIAASCGNKLLEFFYVLLTVHLCIILDNDQLDTHLLYFTICLL